MIFNLISVWFTLVRIFRFSPGDKFELELVWKFAVTQILFTVNYRCIDQEDLENRQSLVPISPSPEFDPAKNLLVYQLWVQRKRTSVRRGVLSFTIIARRMLMVYKVSTFQNKSNIMSAIFHEKKKEKIIYLLF